MEATTGDMRMEVQAVLDDMGGASEDRVAHLVAARVVATGSVDTTVVSHTLAVEEIFAAVQRSYQ
jgi:hypothetical protein